MNYKIDWENLTEEEAQVILDGICATFNVLAKTHQNNKGLNDVSYLEINGIYDGNFHANFGESGNPGICEAIQLSLQIGNPGICEAIQLSLP